MCGGRSHWSSTRCGVHRGMLDTLMLEAQACPISEAPLVLRTHETFTAEEAAPSGWPGFA